MFRSALLFSFFAVFAAAQTNSDAPSDPLEPANSALHAGDIDLAVTLLQALVAKDPPVAAARPLLVDILLDQDKVDAAEDIVQKGLASNPESGDLHRLKGDVEYRKGDLKSASAEYAKAAKMNSKDARAVYGTARVASALSLNQTAFLLYRLASRLAPHDEAIVGAFTRDAATDQEQADALERYLASLDRDGQRRYQWLVARMELRKFLAGRRTWQLASPYQPSRVRLKTLMDSPHSPIRFGVDVRVNGAKSVPLLLDTGASGVVINRVLAEQAGVKRIADLNLSGIGDKADPTGYLGFAESVRVGDVEFRNCIVHVSDKKSVGEAAGLIGPAIFERFLLTLDFFRRELSLGLLPGPVWDGETPVNRYQGKELDGFTRVVRINSDLLVDTRIEGGPERFFLVDTGSTLTMISNAAARQVTKVRQDSDMRIKGISGEVKNVFSANKVFLIFAGFRQENRDVSSIDLSGISRGAGTEISGIMGMPLLSLFRLTIDYRDGAVKFEFTAH